MLKYFKKLQKYLGFRIISNVSETRKTNITPTGFIQRKKFISCMSVN